MGKKRQLFYEDIFKKLQEKDVRYLAIGGIAVNLYGVPRATADIDLMLSMDRENLSRFVLFTAELGLVPKVPVKTEDLQDPEKLKEWREEKNMRVFSFVDPDEPYIMIDILNDDHLDFEEAYQKREILSAWGIDITTVSLDDLIKLKRISGREQDLADIRSLEKLKEAS